jgi:hypothetical protein
MVKDLRPPAPSPSSLENLSVTDSLQWLLRLARGAEGPEVSYTNTALTLLADSTPREESKCWKRATKQKSGNKVEKGQGNGGIRGEGTPTSKFCVIYGRGTEEIVRQLNLKPLSRFTWPLLNCEEGHMHTMGKPHFSTLMPFLVSQ